ncbi:MAG: bacteriochlorophyll 4-vinyl reductase [Gemmobacter sp.]|nr:bacteriochlorophyll 4-vinyl reductase [Gemmobacter sp.]
MNAPVRGLIGPNAILQHLPVLDAAIGPRQRDALLYLADVSAPPPESGMIPQDDVARFHRFVRLYLPDRADAVQRAAGLGTADYILAHRIPRPAQRLIRLMPAALGARVLAAAIAKHAWTFAGTGAFGISARAPLTFAIGRNPLAVAGRAPSCVWHAAVFERLFARLVWPDVRVRETACCGCGDPACRFELTRPGG